MDADDSLPEISGDILTDLKNYGLGAESWLFNFGNFDLAVGYTLVFWPRFIVIDDYVLHHGTTKKRVLIYVLDPT